MIGSSELQQQDVEGQVSSWKLILPQAGFFANTNAILSSPRFSPHALLMSDCLTTDLHLLLLVFCGPGIWLHPANQETLEVVS